MATTVLYPNGTESTQNITLNGAATAQECVDDVRGAYDDNTTSVRLNVSAGTQYFYVEIQDLPATASVITSVQMEERDQRTGPGAVQGACYYKIGGTEYAAGITIGGGAWTTRTGTLLTTSPATSAAWGVAEINGMAIGAKRTADGAERNDVTGINIQVIYTEGGGGLLAWMHAWLPPLLAVASHCLSKLEIINILSNLKTRPSSDEEFDMIINAFKRRPAFAFLGR